MPANEIAKAPSATGRYTQVAMALHWSIAVFILFNLGLGYFMEGFPPALKRIVMPLHFSSGMTVLALTLGRIVWRLTHPAPPHNPELPPMERNTAHIVHFLLYVGMVLMPLTGWAILSAHPPAGTVGAAAAAAARPAPPPGTKAPPPGPPRIWWTVPLVRISPIEAIGATPGGLAPQKALHDEVAAWHGIGGFIMIALLLLHVAGALKHQYFDRQAELERMGIRTRRRAAIGRLDRSH